MRRAISIMLPLVGLIFSGCTTPYKVSGIKSERQAQIFRNNKDVLISTKHHTVGITCESVNDGNAMFAVVVVNKGDQHIVLSQDCVSATMTNGQPLKIVTKEQIEKKSNGDQAWEGFADGFMYGVLGPYPGTPGQIGLPGVHYSGTFPATTYGHAMAMEALNMHVEPRFYKTQEFLSTYIGADSIFPNQGCLRRFKVRMLPLKRNRNELLIKVNLETEEHVFSFKQSKA
jgi:hypothetical protein